MRALFWALVSIVDLVLSFQRITSGWALPGGGTPSWWTGAGLSCDWSTLITWPEYWPPIGWWHPILARPRPQVPLGLTDSADGSPLCHRGRHRSGSESSESRKKTSSANFCMFAARCREEGAWEVWAGQGGPVLHHGILCCLSFCQVSNRCG